MKTSFYLLIYLIFISNLYGKEVENIDLISNVDMFDVGLAKINDDAYYDIYTINHIFAESILLSNKNGFTESSLKLGLSQTNNMPNHEPSGNSPKVQKGLNIFSSLRRQLVIYCKQCDRVVNGVIKFPTSKNDGKSVKLIYREYSQLTQKLVENINTGDFIEINFSLEKNGLLVLDVLFMDVYIDFEIDYPAQSIFISESNNSPASNKFKINARDNHSFSWAKVNNDMHTDVFMATGGLRALIDKFNPSQIIKELFYIYQPLDKLFHDNYIISGIKKDSCRSYKSQWIDFDDDGDLDLYIGCKNGANILNQQIGLGSGRFQDVAADYGINLFYGDEFRWIDINNDNAIDLLSIEENQLNIYSSNQIDSKITYSKKIFQPVLGANLDSIFSTIKVFDINNDAIPEIFISTKQNIYYFKFDKRLGYRNQKLSTINLPTNLKGDLNFVDVNLDGYIDLCIFNHGIFLQDSSHQFSKANMLSELFINRDYHYKNLLWFDKDIDGSWDVLDAMSYGENSIKKGKILSYAYHDIRIWDKLKYHKNIIRSTNNWLQIDLVGLSFNRDAIGAKIEVYDKNKLSQTRYNYGTNDTLHSQGHYRQYFGVGNHDEVDIKVTWPDGIIDFFHQVSANQLMTIKQPEPTNTNSKFNLQKVLLSFMSWLFKNIPVE